MKALTTFFFVIVFLVSLAYFTEIKWLILKKTIIFQGSRGGPTFSRGGPTFSRGGEGGSNCLFPIETHITCDFPGGSGPPVPPLDPHLLNMNYWHFDWHLLSGKRSYQTILLSQKDKCP